MNTKYISGNTVLKTHSWIILSLIVLILAFLCNSCSTNANKGTISGTVILVNDTDNPSLNPVDYAGVTVALYKIAVLDTTLVRINQQYPQIGVQITQETEFDHRNFNPLKVVTTDAEGKFNFPSLTAGNYNLVLWKTDWGIRYLCSIRAEEKENNNLGTIELYPATSYNSTIVSEPTIFKSDHSYFVLTDVNFMSSVEFQPRAQIFINPAAMLKFYGAVTTPEFTSPKDMWKITSGKEIYSTAQVTMDFDSYYSTVNFYGDEINLKSGELIYGTSSINIINSLSINLSFLLLRYCSSGITLEQGEVNINNLIISNCYNYGISCTANAGNTNSDFFTKCIFFNIKTGGILINIQGYYNITDCYFSNIYKSISAKLGDCNISHNNFENNYFNIYFDYISNQNHQITYNNFYSATICIQPTGEINNINYNNFYLISDWYITIRRILYPYSLVTENVDATHNYWYESNVDKYLADGNDNDEFGSNCQFYIIYQPILDTPLRDAGIQ